MIKGRFIIVPKWKEITPGFFQFETKGQSLEGKLLGYSEIRIKEILVKRWAIATLPDGIVTNFLGGVSLDPMLEAVPEGTIIKLEFDGFVRLEKNQRVKTFKLYQAIKEEEAPRSKK